MRKAIVFILLAFLLALGATPAYADDPTVPHAFYGNLTINDSAAPVATSVEARGTGVTTGITGNPITTTQAGKYGGAGALDQKLVVQGDIADGATITFYVNGVPASPTAAWHSGEITSLHLSVTIAAPAPPAGGGVTDDGTPPEVPAELGVPSITDVADVVSEEGVFTEEVTAVSEDANIEAFIAEGTVGLTAEGAPLSEITIAEVTAPSPPPAGANVAALVYHFGPDGATFEPPIEVTFTCNIDLAAIPEGTVLVVVEWNEAAGAWVDIEVAPEDYIIDTVANTVTVPISHFSKYAVITRPSPLPLPVEEIIPPAPAAFSVSNLTIQPVEVQPKEAVIITISVANTGDLAGTYKVSLKINNVVVDTKDVTLDGGTSQKVTFTTSKDVAGSYTVNVGALSGTFVVKAKAPSVPPKPINWWLIGGIIAGCIIIAVVIILVVRRRRY